MVAHASRAWRENREVGPAFALHLELAVHDGLAQFVVGHRRARRDGATVGKRLDLGVTPRLVLARRGRVVPVAIDNHGVLANLLIESAASRTAGWNLQVEN